MSSMTAGKKNVDTDFRRNSVPDVKKNIMRNQTLGIRVQGQRSIYHSQSLYSGDFKYT